MELSKRILPLFLVILALACGGGGGGTSAPVMPPVISSFTADRTVLSAGDQVVLTAVFQHGVGTISPLGGVVSSGVPVTLHPTVDTTFQLIVQNEAGASVQRTLSVQIVPAPQTPVIVVPPSVPPGQSGFSASVVNQTGCTFTWHLENGTITAGNSTNRILFTSGVAGLLRISCTATNTAGASATSTPVDVPVAPVVPPTARRGGIFCQPQAFVGQQGLLASLPASPGRTYEWSLSGGMFTSPLDQQVLTYTAGSAPGEANLFASFRDLGGLSVQSSRSIQWVADAFLKRPSETIPRIEFKAVLLLDGRILVCGGVREFGGSSSLSPLASAELYDPATGTWASTGSMLRARRGHSATLLPDGRVLVAGGGGDTRFFDDSSQPLVDCECYDPATGTWSSAAPLSHPRFLHSATLMANGLVLVAGGQDASAQDAEQYDPAMDRWTPVEPLLVGRKGHAATLLADGRVLVSGGDSQGFVTTRCEIFDPATGSWSETGAMAEGRRVHVSALLPGGRVLAAGGASNGAAAYGLKTCEVFEPATGTWASTGPLPDGYEGPRAAALPDGSILLLGGQVVVRYDPALGTWSPAFEPCSDRGLGEITVLPDGQAMLLGGRGQATFTERWDPNNGTLVRSSSMLAARGASPVFRLYDGTLLLTGGLGTLPDGSYFDCERYNPATDDWTLTGSMNQVGRAGYGHTVLADGSVLAAGGFGAYSFGNAGPLRTVERYDPATGQWCEAAPMTMWRYGNDGALLPDGRFLMAGNEVPPYGVAPPGWTQASPSFGEIYDPATDTWQSTRPMARPRSGFALVSLPNGKVLAAGGVGIDALYATAYTYATAELYDPALDLWTSTGTLSQAREQFTSVTLADGRVLVAGGMYRDLTPFVRLVTLSSAEIYNPTTGTWSPTSPMSRPRAFASGALLPDGRVLIAGGNSDLYAMDPEISAEIYDPATDQWTPAGDMPTPCMGPTLAPLDDGRWLVLGQASTLTTFFKPRP